jgi:trehalose-6-phosphatase
LILLDYDGTVVNFTKEPNKAAPNEYLLHLLEQLTKNKNVNKGKATQKWLSKNEWDFVLALGDDVTDEDTF